MCGGNSASTDRRTQLGAEGGVSSTANALKTLGPELTKSGLGITDTGLADTEKASKAYSDILSGDPAKVATAAAPEVAAATGQEQQAKKQIVAGGNRAGGTNAAAQDMDSSTRSIIANAIAKTRSGAAAGLERTGAQVAGVGTQRTGEGIGATGAAGSEFLGLSQEAAASRVKSHEIHQQAVEDWAKVIGDVLSARVSDGAGA